MEPFDWPRRFFGLGRREMERGFEDMEKRIPKDLIIEYTTTESGKVREVGPMVQWYMVIQ